MASIVSFEEDPPSVRTYGIMGCLIRKVVNEDDTKEEVERKAMVVPVFCFLTAVEFVIAVWWMMLTLGAGNVMDHSTGAVLIMFITSFVSVARILITRTATLLLCEVFFFMHAMALILLDWGNSAHGAESWPLIIIAMDGVLVVGGRASITTIMAFATCLWLTLRSAEEVYRVGLFDVVPLYYTEVAGCQLPPRAITLPNGIGRLLIRILVFLLDYYFTRGFALGMRAEQARMQLSVDMAEKVAQSLVRFDLVSAEKYVNTLNDAEELSRHFQSLIANLHMYEPFLPEALFANHDYSDMPQRLSDNAFGEGTEVAPVGKITMVFTDIQDSTNLWETSQEGMRHALSIHNEIMRSRIKANHGYEVKTIGDAFMVAFARVEDAVTFCLEVQCNLRDANWSGSSDLASHHLFTQHTSEKGNVTWNGLRVRMGVHTGAAEMEVNPVTKRSDYFGPTVNKAARTEASSVGGVVAITQEVLNELEESSYFDTHAPIRVPPAMCPMKGIGNVMVHGLIPRELEGREADVKLGKKDVKAAETKSPPPPPGRRRGSVLTNGLSVSSLYEPRDIMPTMRTSVGTVAFLILRSSETATHEVQHGLSQSLHIVEDCVDKTGGVVLGLIGNTAGVSWNAGGRACPSHASQAALFAGLVSRRVSPTVGEATGIMQHGTVGAGRRKYVTTVGPCVEVAQALSRKALSCGARVLVAGVGHPSSANDTAFQHSSRPIDVWQIKGLRDPIVIYEMNHTSLTDKWGMSSGDDGVWGSAEYRDAFSECFVGVDQNVASITAILNRPELGHDEVLKGVKDLVRGGHHAATAKPLEIGFVGLALHDDDRDTPFLNKREQSGSSDLLQKSSGSMLS